MSETENNKVVTLTTAREAAGISQDLISQIITETTRQIEARVSRPSPMKLDTWEDVEAFAERAAVADLTPERYQGKPADIIMAVMKGKEVGLPPITSLESIAVIDKRACIYGQAVPGLCWASGKCEDIHEYFEGDEGTDGYTAVCVVKRRGAPSPFVGRFSVKDSKVAGLFGKRVHGSYPKRMLQWRARYAIDDAFPDVLMGLAIRELVEEDAARPAWVLPKPEKGWFTARPKSKDGWDDAWFDGVATALFNEQNAWEWMNLLVGKLKEAPTLRDVDELAALAVVAKTTEAAPEQAKGVIGEAFTEARKRLAPPESKPVETAKTNAPAKAAEKPAETVKVEAPQPAAEKQPAQQAAAEQAAPVEFEAFLLDEWGEPIGDDSFTDPVLFAKAFVALWEKSENRDALVEHNADGIEDAKAGGDIIADILAHMVTALTSAEEPDPVVVEAPKAGTRDSWKGWLTLFREEAARLTAGGYLPFIAANTEVIKLAPGSVRPLAIKALIEQAGTLKIEAPNLAAMLKPPAKAPEPAKEAAPPPAEEETKTETAEQGTAPDHDRVEMDRWVTSLQYAKTPDEVDTLARNPALGRVAAGWRSEGKMALIAALQKAFSDHKASLKGAGP